MGRYAAKIWDSVTEGAARIVEKKSLSNDARVEWTAAVIAIHRWYYPDGTTTTRTKTGGGITLSTKDSTPPPGGVTAPKWVSETRGDGPLFLAWEAHDLGLITKKQLDRETWDTVYWVAGYRSVNGKKKPNLKRIARDFGNFKDSIRTQLDAMGLQRPRTDELERFLGVAVALAATASAIAVTIIVPASAGATVPYILGIGGTVSDALFDQASKDDAEFAAQARAAGVENVTVEDDTLYRGAAGASLGVGSMYGTQDATAKDYLDAAIRGYQAATTPPAAAAPATPAPASTAGEWIKSPTGMIVTGAAVVLVLVLALRK